MERIPNSQFAVTGATIGLIALALVTFSRRVAGLSPDSLPPGEATLYTAVFAAAGLAAAHWLAEAFIPAGRYKTVVPITSFLSTLLFLAGLTTEPVAILSGAVAGAAVIGLATHSAKPVDRGTATVSASELATAPSRAPLSPQEGTEAAASDETGVSEHRVELIRTIVDTGEHIAGSLRFETVPGATATTLHVPLWPPLAGPPRVRCELEGIDGRVCVPYAKPHGFRIEIRLPEPVDEPLEGVVRFQSEHTARTAAA